MADSYSNRTLRELVRIVASRFQSMAAIFIVVVAVVAVASWLMPRWYRSEVTLLARPGAMGNPLEIAQVSLMRDNVSLFVMTHREIITSDWVLASALMKVDAVPVDPRSESDSLKPWYTQEQIGEYVRDNTKSLQQLRKRVAVITPGGADATFTQNFTIRVDCPEGQKLSRTRAAHRAYELAQAINEAYLARFTMLETQRSSQALHLLQEQSLAPARQQMEQASEKFHDFIEKELRGDLLQVINMVGGRAVGAETGDASLATRFRGEINKIDERSAEVTALKAAIDHELSKTDDAGIVVPDAVTAANPSIGTLQAKIIDSKILLNSLNPRYTESYQQLDCTQQELAAARADLRGELTKQSARLDQEYAVLQSRRAVLAQKVLEDRQRVDELASKVSRYDRLHRDVESTQAIFDEEQRRVISALTAEKLAQTPVLVSVLDEANQPDPNQPRRPIVWLNILIAAISGLVLAFAYAFLADHYDHSIKSIDEAERYIGVPVLVSVPRLTRTVIRQK